MELKFTKRSRQIKPFFLIHIDAQLASPQLPADLLDLQLHWKKHWLEKNRVETRN